MSENNYIRTVLGDIKPDCQGVTLPHEHTMFGWNGAEFDHRALFDFDAVVNSNLYFSLGLAYLKQPLAARAPS